MQLTELAKACQVWRLALVGDAAHVPTPMTGAGFSASLDDAEAIAESVAAGVHGSALPMALRQYERERLGTVRNMVQSGQQFSRSFTSRADLNGVPLEGARHWVPGPQDGMTAHRAIATHQSLSRNEEQHRRSDPTPPPASTVRNRAWRRRSRALPAWCRRRSHVCCTSYSTAQASSGTSIEVRALRLVVME